MDPSGSVEVALQTEQDRLKAELRQRLGSANVFRNETPVRLVEAQDNQGGRTVDVTSEHLTQLCADVVSRLSEIIQGQIDEYWRNTAQGSKDRAARELEIEQREYERFAKERGGEESFVGRQVELQAILDYVGSDSCWPLVIHGASGCGKTALLARASQEVAKTRKRIERFIGVAPRSSGLRSLLSSLCQKLRQRNPRADALPTEIKELRDEFAQHLQAATPEQPLILFLDALDQLADADNGRLLNWLPLGSLPAHVKLVVSCLSDRAAGDPADQPYAELNRRQIPAGNFINLDVLLETEARSLLFDRWLPKAGRKVSDDQRARIEQRLASPACRQPIFLKLLFEEVQLWHSYDPAPVPGESVPALLGQLFDRLSLETNHGPLLVNRVLGYLSASRHGLAENEILEILFADPEYRARLTEATEQTRHELPPNAKRIPIALWSRLRFDLAPYLTERAAPGANVLTFYHRQVGEAVDSRYLAGPEKHRAHRKLASYFRQRADPADDGEWAGNCPRGLSELPYHHTCGAMWAALEITLCDLRFIAAKCAGGMPYQLQADYAYALDNWPRYKRPNPFDLITPPPTPPWMPECVQSLLKGEDDPHPEVGVGPWIWYHDIARAERLDTTVHEMYSRSPDWCFSPGKWASEGLREMRIAEKTPAGGVSARSKPLRAVRVQAFASFVGTYLHLLTAFPDETVLIARNSARTGIVVERAQQLAETTTRPWIARLHRPPLAPTCPLCIRTLMGHSQGVSAIAMTASGRIALSASLDGTLRVWDLTTGNTTQILSGHTDAVTCVAMCSRGTTAVSGSADQTLRVWDVAGGRTLQVLEGHVGGVTSVTMSVDGRLAVSGSLDNTLRVWDLTTGQILRVLEWDDGSGSKLQTSTANLTISAPLPHYRFGSPEDKERDLDSYRKARARMRRNPVWCAAGTPDGRVVASGHKDMAVRIWNVRTGQVLWTLDGYPGQVRAMALSVDATVLASASTDNSIRVWFLPLEFCVRDLRGHGGPVRAIALTPDGRVAITGSEDRMLRVWDVASGETIRSLAGHSDTVTAVAITPDGRIAVSGSRDYSVRVWDLAHGRITRPVEAITEDVAENRETGYMETVYRPNVSVLALSTEARRFGNVAGLKSIFRLPKARLTQTPDGRLVIGMSQQGALDVWDLSSSKARSELLGLMEEEMVRERDRLCQGGGISVLPDGKVALYTVAGDVLQLQDLHTRQAIRDLDEKGDIITTVTVARDGRTAVCGGRRGTLSIWNLQTGERLQTLAGSPCPVVAVVLTPDGTTIVSGSEDDALRVWDVDSGRLLAVYPAGAGIAALGDITSAGAFLCDTANYDRHHLRLRRRCQHAPHATAIRLFRLSVVPGSWERHCHLSPDLEGTFDDGLSAYCDWCGEWFRVDDDTLRRIAGVERGFETTAEESCCLRMPTRFWEDTALHSNCPNCHRPVQFNPFIVDTRDSD